MLGIREALEQMVSRFAPLGVEVVPLLAARGRVLAHDLTAGCDLPGFDHSAMDGYALKHAELATEAGLPVEGEARARAGEVARLAPGTAMRIFTGGQLPEGADTVVMQENVELEAGSLRFLELPRPGANVRRAGSDLRAGELALRQGSRLGPGEIGLLAALELAEVRVFRRPRVAILPTGDELRELGSPPQPGSIVNSNALCLAAAVAEAGCEPEILPIARDRRDELRAGVQKGLQADLLLTIGGVSVGDYDLVQESLADAGLQVIFHKVAIKPGKPLLFGLAHGRPVIGLPGNPVSSLVTFEVFVRPCLSRMLGVRQPFAQLLRVELARPTRHSRGRTEFARARLVHREGRLLAELLADQGSGSLRSIAEVDALVLLEAERTQFEAGEAVLALLLHTPDSEASPFED